MLIDCCSDRSKIEKAKQENLDKEEIERLFKDNTKMALDDNKYDESLPSSGLSKSTANRLKIEFRMIRHVMRILNSDSAERITEANDLVNEYYSNQICKTKFAEKCNNTNWCTSCSVLHLVTTKDIGYLDDVLMDNFKFI